MPNHTVIKMRGSGPSSRERQPLPWFVEQLRARFYLGELTTGGRLPPIRELARQIQASPTTVQQLYKQLEGEGLVEARERSGTFLKRLGIEADRGPREMILFKLLRATAGKLRLLSVSPPDFCRWLLRASGSEARDDLKFGFVAVRETYEMVVPQLHRALGPHIPIVHLSPHVASRGGTRSVLARDRTIGCLLTTYLSSRAALDLAREFGLRVILVQLHQVTARVVLKSPATGFRWIITRDRECAEGFRKLIAEVVPAPARIGAVALSEARRLNDPKPEPAEAYATPAALAPVRALWEGRFPVLPLPTELSQQTIDDVLFHYLFSNGR
jgi:DNA-binding transcriptional regulator YhcF (GntR family)